MEQVLLIDFFDSFTFNIVSEIAKLGLTTKVVPYKSIPKNISQKIVILGPGPGCPKDYKSIFPTIQKILDDQSKFIMGICLGHQIIWALKGHLLKKSKTPIHGRQVLIEIPQWSEFDKSYWGKKLPVQRYNSLAIYDPSKSSERICDGEEMLMGKFSNGLSYQFHPESVGTSHSALFFGPLRKLCQQELN